MPMISLQIAAYNEPPDMLIETIKSAEFIDYPNFEIVIIDNNTGVTHGGGGRIRSWAMTALSSKSEFRYSLRSCRATMPIRRF